MPFAMKPHEFSADARRLLRRAEKKTGETIGVLKSPVKPPHSRFWYGPKCLFIPLELQGHTYRHAGPSLNTPNEALEALLDERVIDRSKLWVYGFNKHGSYKAGGSAPNANKPIRTCTPTIKEGVVLTDAQAAVIIRPWDGFNEVVFTEVTKEGTVLGFTEEHCQKCGKTSCEDSIGIKANGEYVHYQSAYGAECACECNR